MNHFNLKLCSIFVLFFLFPKCGWGQGTFQNLGFEGVQNVPIFDPRGHPWTMPAGDALPGWSCYIGDSRTEFIWYNDLALDSAAVGVLSSTLPYLPPGFPVGKYSLSLQAGYGPLGMNTPSSIAQSGELPSDVKSIRFRGAGGSSSADSFLVTFAGERIPLEIVGSRESFTGYAGDLSPYAGQMGELRITSTIHFTYIDGISFSPLAVPEPTIATLLLGGLGLLGWNRWRTSK